MKKLILSSLCVLLSSIAFAWGPRGHATTAALADLNLKPSTKAQVEAYLGRSIPFYSAWMDEFRDEPEYKFSSSCHTFPAGADYTYEPVEGKMDALKLLDQAVAIVKDRKNQTDSAVVVNLKFIIHIVGDIHCPVHVKYTTINTAFKVIPYKGETEQIKYHTVWDAQIIDRKSNYISPAEMAADFNRLSKKEIKEIQSGSPVDWANENAAESIVIYEMAQPGETLYKPFYNPAWPIVQKQIIRGGYRLAKVLNDCFSK